MAIWKKIIEPVLILFEQNVFGETQDCASASYYPNIASCNSEPKLEICLNIKTWVLKEIGWCSFPLYQKRCLRRASTNGKLAETLNDKVTIVKKIMFLFIVLFHLDGNEGVLSIPQSSSITGALPSDCLVSYPGHLLERVLSLCKDAVGVFYSPSWLGNHIFWVAC